MVCTQFQLSNANFVVTLRLTVACFRISLWVLGANLRITVELGARILAY